MMKRVQKGITLLLSIILVIELLPVNNFQAKAEEETTETQNSYWGSYFGVNNDWYEGAEGTLIQSSETGFTAHMDSVGNGGVWGGQVFHRFENPNFFTTGKTLSFSISSTINKYVYFKLYGIDIDEAVQTIDSFWVYIPANETIYVNRLLPQYNFKLSAIYFGIGGDFGDRDSYYDSDAEERYKLLGDDYTSILANDANGNSSSSCDITVSNFNIEINKNGYIGTLHYELNEGMLILSGDGPMLYPLGPDKEIETVKILDGVTSICENAFCDFAKLTSVTIPSSVTNIENGVFDDCDNFTDLYVLNNKLSLLNVGLASKVTIHCNYDSAAYWFAKQNGNNIVLLNDGVIDEEPTTENPTTAKPSAPEETKTNTIVDTKKTAKVNFKLKAGKKKVTIKWNKVKGASGYTIYYKTSKKGAWKKVKNVSAKKKKYIKKKLKKGKIYYFTVKAYKLINGKKVYGKFKTKKIKVKK